MSNVSRLSVAAEIIAGSIQRKGSHDDVEEVGITLPATVTDARSRAILLVIDESSSIPDSLWKEDT